MKKRWDKIAAATFSVIMGLSLAACGASQTAEITAAAVAGTTVAAAASTETGTQGTPGGPVALQISWWGGDSRHEATEKTVQSSTEKYPNITVDCEYGTWTGWEEKQPLNILSGGCADVIQIGSNWVTDYSKGGELYLDLYQVADVLDLSQFSEDKPRLNGVNRKLAAIPTPLTRRLFYRNKTTFDEVGRPILTDEASLLAAGEASKAYNEEYCPLALGEYDRMTFMVYYLEFKYRKDWVIDGVTNYTEEEITEGFAFMNKPEEMHVLPSIATVNGNVSDSLDKNVKWIDGKYVGLMEWDFAVTEVKEAMGGNVNKPGQEFQIGEFIKFGDCRGGFTKVSMDFAIKVSTKYPKEVALLVNYLLNDPEGVEICSTERGVPHSAVVVAILNEKSIGDAMTREANAKVMDYSKSTQDPKFDDSELKASPDGIYYKVFGKFSSGSITPGDVTETLTEGINEVFGN